jgi:hypothetical protein
MVAHIGAEVAAALAVAHASSPSVTHGALGPANVMITPQGAVKLMDLGLRAAVHTPAELAASPGRRPYVAPELAGAGKPSTAADVFALGVVVRELATGRAAASGAGPAGPRLAALAPALAEAVGALVDPEPGERPSAAKAAELFAAAAGGLDLRAELGALARKAMQARPQEEPAAAADSVDPGPLGGRTDDSGVLPLAAHHPERLHRGAHQDPRRHRRRQPRGAGQPAQGSPRPQGHRAGDAESVLRRCGGVVRQQHPHARARDRGAGGGPGRSPA